MAKIRKNATFDSVITKPEELGVIGDLFTVRLQRADRLLGRAVTKAWAGRRLRAGTIGVLSQIVEYPGISQNEIVKRTILDKSAINLIVNGLEKLGWAERRKSVDDRRRQALHATEDGTSALLEIVDRIRQIETRMLAKVSPAVLDQLRDLLDQVHASCLAAYFEEAIEI